MILLATILTASLTMNTNVDVDLTGLFNHATPKIEVVGMKCGISTVGYRFTGKPGQEFRYAGDRYTIPSEGFVELIADAGNTSYRVGSKSLPLNVWPIDQFGFRVVSLPSVN
jgi:hypothetical protein